MVGRAHAVWYSQLRVTESSAALQGEGPSGPMDGCVKVRKSSAVSTHILDLELRGQTLLATAVCGNSTRAARVSGYH